VLAIVRFALCIVMVGGLGTACGDDDAPMASDAGPDASPRAGTTGTIGRRDAQVTGTDPVP
jgi:hypothetical protein